MSELSTRLRLRRKELGLSQEELARRRRTRVDRSDMTVLLKTMCCGVRYSVLP